MLQTPCFKVDNAILSTWTTDRIFVFIVTQDEILKIHLTKLTRNVLLKLEWPAVSAWVNHEDRSLVLLTRSKVSVIDTNRWTIVKELDLPDQYAQLVQSLENDQLWITTIPSFWSSRVKTKSKFLHVVGTPRLVITVDIETGKTFSSQERDLNRGQYLSQFFREVSDSVHMTPLSSLVTLVTRSLSCSFIKSSIHDVAISSSLVVILTVNGDVWRVPRRAASKTKTLVTTNVSSLSLRGEDLTVLKLDGAVFWMNLSSDNNDSGVSLLRTKKTGDISDLLFSQVETLRRLGSVASEVDLRLEQIQLYQFLQQNSLQQLQNFFTFDTELTGSQNLLHVRFGLKETNFKISGKSWFMRLELSSGAREQKRSLKLNLPEIFSSRSDPISTSTSVTVLDGSLEVRVSLVFQPSLDRIATRSLHLPSVLVAESEIEVRKCETDQTDFDHENNFLAALKLNSCQAS